MTPATRPKQPDERAGDRDAVRERRRTIDRLRRAQRLDDFERRGLLTPAAATETVDAEAEWSDDRLRLIFTCCHPALTLDTERLPERLDGVLAVIYLIFNEGYSPSAGESVLDPTLAGEAIRLARLLVDLGPSPDFREARALLALLLLHDSRRAARQSSEGEIVLLEDQDRGLWDRAQIAEGLRLIEQALREGPARGGSGGLVAAARTFQ